MGRMNPSHLPPARFTPALARIVATVSVGFVVTQLDVTIVNIALAQLATDLHASVARLQWIVDAYTLAFAVLMLSGGVLGDRGQGQPLGAALPEHGLSGVEQPVADHAVYCTGWTV